MQLACLLVVVKLSGPDRITLNAASLRLFSSFGFMQTLHMLFTLSAYLLCTSDCCRGGVCTCVYRHTSLLMLLQSAQYQKFVLVRIFTHNV